MGEIEDFYIRKGFPIGLAQFMELTWKIKAME